MGVPRDRMAEREDRFFPRLIALLGYLLALLLLLGTRNIPGILLAFPLWGLFVSLHILIADRRGRSQGSAPALGEVGP